MSESNSAAVVGGGDAKQDSLPGAEKALRTALYRTLRFQSFIREFSNPKVRAAFLGGHFGVRMHSQEMLASIDKIAELIMPSLEWDEDPWDPKSHSGVDFITDMMDGVASEPLDRYRCTLPVRMSYQEWLTYFGELKKATYWQEMSKDLGSLNDGPEKTGGATGLGEQDGREDLKGATVHSGDKFVPLSQSSPINKSGVNKQGYGVTHSPGSSSELHSPPPGVIKIQKARKNHLDYVLAGGRARRERQGQPNSEGERVSRVPGSPTKMYTGARHPSSNRTKIYYNKRHKNKSSSSESLSFPRSHREKNYQSRGKQCQAGGRQERSSEDEALRFRRNANRHEKRVHGTKKSKRKSRRPSSSFSSSSSEESLVSASGSTSEDEDSYGHGRSLVRALGRLQLSREVVAPGKFSGVGGGSLRRYLQDFERYFSTKYRGTERQSALLLGDFLEGPVKKAYLALGGPNIKYRKLKPKLISWYKTERSSHRRSKEEEFEGACLEEEESLSIYALRLERLASEAFPASQREQSRALCKKFWESVPRGFAKVLANSEHSLALMEGKHLRWHNMKKLAEVEDRHRKRMNIEQKDSWKPKKEVWFGQPEQQYFKPKGFQPVSNGGNPSFKSRQFERSAPIQAGPQSAGLAEPSKTARLRSRSASTNRTAVCNWCGRRGHQVDTCRLKLGLCILCGSDKHKKEECPRFDREWKKAQPVCPVCKGDHFGRDCPSHPLNG